MNFTALTADAGIISPFLSPFREPAVTPHVSEVLQMHELFEHTADLGLRAAAPDINTLFAEMAACLMEAMVEEPLKVLPRGQVLFEVQGTDREFLLFDWLKALLLRIEEDQMLFSEFVVNVADSGLTATARGETYDPARHALAHEVKAITYHELKVEERNDGWFAEVIVDI